MSGPSRMQLEMDQQPEVLRRLVARAESDAHTIRRVVPEPLGGITFVARGSSDNAAVIGRYLAELASRRPASLAAPSLHTLYASEADFRGFLAVALSQSGATPEINTVLGQIARGGGATVAVTNDPESPLAAAAEAVYDLAAGPEEAVPATKTVTAQMFAMVVLAAALGETAALGELEAVPTAVAALLGEPQAAGLLARRWGEAERMIVVSRGIGLGCALEGALKIEELTGIQATGFSSADLRHGPIATVGEGTPVLLIDLGGAPSADLSQLREEIASRGGSLAVCAPRPEAELTLPLAPRESLQAIAATVRLQQLALELALLRGHDPDRPGGLSKVTLTQ